MPKDRNTGEIIDSLINFSSNLKSFTDPESKQTSNWEAIESKLNQILEKLESIEERQQSQNEYYLKNGIWRKL